jgi:hypothetical protein
MTAILHQRLRKISGRDGLDDKGCTRTIRIGYGPTQPLQARFVCLQQVEKIAFRIDEAEGSSNVSVYKEIELEDGDFRFKNGDTSRLLT